MPSVNSLLSQIDWDFPNVRNEGMCSFHWYPATFVSALPGSIIPILTKVDALVVDPFCGTATTGIEAVRLGRQFIGVDINPVAAMIGKARLAFPRLADFRKDVLHAADDYLSLRPSNSSVIVSNSTEIQEWYHRETYRELVHLSEVVSGISSQSSQLVARAVFSSILKNCCAQSKHWGWVCDNVKPKRGEIVYKNAIEAFAKSAKFYESSLLALQTDMKERSTWKTLPDLRTCASVRCDDSINQLLMMPKKSVDLIFTSPPYNGVADYVKSQRLSLLWMSDGLLSETSGRTLEEMRLLETGARSKRHRSSNLTDYINYMRTFFSAAFRVVKRNAYVCLVVGESNAREGTIEAIDQSALLAGFDREFDTSREIKTTRRRLMAKMSTERVIIYKRP